jgi:hypothetical protein
VLQLLTAKQINQKKRINAYLQRLLSSLFNQKDQNQKYAHLFLLFPSATTNQSKDKLA